MIRSRLAAIPESSPEHLLFFTKRGTPLTPYNVRRVFRQVLTLAELDDRRITPHSFRKTVATLISQEADDQTAAAMLGHDGTRTTRQHYIQRVEKPNPVTAAILEQLAPRDSAGRSVPLGGGFSGSCVASVTW